MIENTLEINIKGYITQLPILPLPSGEKIAFFNLHGDTLLTEHCGKQIAKLIPDAEVIITAESKGLQLAHVISRELGHANYAVARKSKKLYMQDGISVNINSSITTGAPQSLYLSKHDTELLLNKRIAIVDDVISTGNSLEGLINIAKLAGATVIHKIFVLAEGNAKDREGIEYLATIPLL